MLYSQSTSRVISGRKQQQQTKNKNERKKKKGKKNLDIRCARLMRGVVNARCLQGDRKRPLRTPGIQAGGTGNA